MFYLQRCEKVNKSSQTYNRNILLFIFIILYVIIIRDVCNHRRVHIISKYVECMRLLYDPNRKIDVRTCANSFFFCFYQESQNVNLLKVMVMFFYIDMLIWYQIIILYRYESVPILKLFLGQYFGIFYTLCRNSGIFDISNKPVVSIF